MIGVMRVGELLVRAKVVAPEHLEDALKVQVMCGARIGTVLVELGHIDLDGLSNALGYQRGLPAALAAHFDRADRALQLLLSPNVAEQYACVPLRRVGKRAVAVAVASPLEKREIAVVADELGVDPERVIVAIAPELRIRYVLERVYNIPRPQRFLRAPGAPQSPPKQVALGGTTLPLDESAPTATEQQAGERRSYVQAIRASSAPERGGAPRRRRTSEIPTDEAAALASIRSSGDRDRIAKRVIDAVVHLEPAAELVLLLTRRSNVAVGWSVYHREGRSLPPLAIPLDQVGLIAAAFGRCKLHTAELHPIDHGLLMACGLEHADLVVEPIRANDQVIAALAVASFGGAERSTIAAIAAAAGDGFARLMREALAASLR